MFDFQIPDVNAVCKRVLQRHQDDIEALNKLQLSKGIRSDNTSLPAYKKSYLKTRRKHGRPTSPMDLNLTGQFYEKFFVEFYNSYLNIGSRDGKGPVLEEMFRSDIYGLTQENLDVLLWQMGFVDDFITELKTEMFG